MASTTTPETSSAGSRVFLARQPIVTQNKETFGYELLFRSSASASYDHADGDEASLRVMANTLHLVHWKSFSPNIQYFINITRQTLLNEDYRAMPVENTVVELLESVVPDDRIYEACLKLKEYGYQLALDDFTYTQEYEQLLGIADFIKIDFRQYEPAEWKELAHRLSLRKARLLAEKVETIEEFNEAIRAGFTYFQGFFVCKPEIVSGRELPVQKQKYLELIQLINQPRLNYDLVERTIREDPALTFKMMRYINCALLGIRNKVQSIKHALVMLGETAVRKWAALAVFATLCGDRHNPMLPTCLTRAYFCESFAKDLCMARRENDLFMFGLLSGIDVVFGYPLDEVLIQVPLPRDVKVALRGAHTQLGNLMSLFLALEAGKWDHVVEMSKELGLEVDLCAERWIQAMNWANEVSMAS